MQLALNYLARGQTYPRDGAQALTEKSVERLGRCLFECTQNGIDSRLIPGALRLEPFENIGV